MAAHSSHASRSASSISHQRDQLRRFLYPSLISTDRLPLLLPLSQSQDKEAGWIRLDLECQLLIAQVLRIAIQPWYSKLTNDRQLYEEVIRVVAYGLHNAKIAMLRSNSNVTRIEHFLLYDMTSILQRHYDEVRRAVTISSHQGESEGSSAAAIIFLASNPHPALSITAQAHLQIDEDFLDLLLLAILQGVLPEDHLASHNETLLVIDIIKGIYRGQARLHGSGAWVVVRLLSSLLETSDAKQNGAPSPSITKVTSRWQYRANLTLGLSLVFAVFKTLFFYLAVFYLDLFTPLAEPKKRSNRRKRSEMDRPNGWDLNPVLDVIVESLLWRSRITTRFIEEWLRIGLAWGGNRIIERQVKESLAQRAQPERIQEHLARLHEILLEMPNQSPPEPVKVPWLEVQEQEYDVLVSKLFVQVQRFPPVALLLGHNELMQRQSIEAALFPFLAPPLTSTCISVVQVANARLLLSMLECFALLVNPALEKEGSKSI
jgi:hypothetical protein